MGNKCGSCGNLAMHTLYKKGKRKCLCCRCYVQAGNIPADWHPKCIREADRKKKSELDKEKTDE